VRVEFPGTRGEIALRSRHHARHSILIVCYRWPHAHPDHAAGLGDGAAAAAYAATLTWRALARREVADLIELCRTDEVRVSTGGFLEYVLTQGPEAVDRYLEEARELGFDIVEISSGFVTLPADDLVALTAQTLAAGVKPKPEVGIQFGAGGASTVEALEAEGTRDVSQAIELARRHLEAGAELVMIESEGSLTAPT
jgi:phosphosulfolactate synthase (CoM biosynthesis protein A)